MSSYLDVSLSPEQRAADLLAQMSLEEKMGQVIGYLPFPAQEYVDGMQKECPNGVGAIAFLWLMMSATVGDASNWQIQLQDMAMSLSEHRIPAMFHIEGVNGMSLQAGTGFPSAMGRGAGWNSKLEGEIGSIIARQSVAFGVSQLFAPVLDVTRDARFGRTAESYSEDPTIVSMLGAAYVNGVNEVNSAGSITGTLGIESTAKHFLGYHISPNGMHANHLNIAARELREIFAKPFQAAISEANLKGIMPAYNAQNGEPLSTSKAILSGLLREEMGFDGVVVADYTALSESYVRLKQASSIAVAGYKGMQAGMDVELPSKAAYNEELMEMFRDGTADEAILDQAVLRILTAKFRMGLFENPYALTGSELEQVFMDDYANEISRKSSYESIVLLKNNGILPLNKEEYAGKRILVLGWHADSIRCLFGGYTYLGFMEGRAVAASTMFGIGADGAGKANKKIAVYPGTYVQKDSPAIEEAARALKPDVTTLLEQIRREFAESDIIYAPGYDYTGNDESAHDSALELAKTADLVILTLGGKYGATPICSTGEGIDSISINLPHTQESFLKKLALLNKKTIGVHFDGRPISSDAADESVDAIVEAWSPAGYGPEAIVSVLTGKYNPGGKLPVTVAYHAGQEPLYYNHPNGSSYHQNTDSAFKSYMDCPREPRYYFGYGLSYTQFSYRDLVLKDKEIAKNQEVRLTFMIENTGDVAGDEIVQIYIRDRYASVVRPNMELVGFKRISLGVGEAKKIAVSFNTGQISYLGEDYQWILEAGDIDILVGASSNDIRLTDTLCIENDLQADGKTRGFYAKAEEI